MQKMDIREFCILMLRESCKQDTTPVVHFLLIFPDNQRTHKRTEGTTSEVTQGCQFAKIL